MDMALAAAVIGLAFTITLPLMVSIVIVNKRDKAQLNNLGDKYVK